MNLAGELNRLKWANEDLKKDVRSLKIGLERYAEGYRQALEFMSDDMRKEFLALVRERGGCCERPEPKGMFRCLKCQQAGCAWCCMDCCESSGPVVPVVPRS
jgi:hypothetical protein